jgi:hypothetical protein
VLLSTTGDCCVHDVFSTDNNMICIVMTDSASEKDVTPFDYEVHLEE